MADWKFYVCVLVMVATVSRAAAFRCYQCSLCNDPFDSSTARKVECHGSCVKGKIGDVVSRGCSHQNLGDTCETKDGAEGCSCTSDLCNSAQSHGISIIGLISTIIALLLWKN